MELNNKASKRSYGDGSIYFAKKKNRYKAVVVIGHKADGTPIKKTKTCQSYKEAQLALKYLHAKHLENRLVSNDRFYFESLFEDWRKFGVSQRIREATKQDYIFLATKYVLPYLGKKRLIDITTIEIDKWLYALEQAGFSPVTRRKARQVANMIFRFAVKKRLVSFNPVGDSTCPEKLINGKSQVRDPLTKEEWLEYLSFFRKTELDTFVHIAALLGLRRSEIVGLDWEDIDFENKVLHVRKSARECTTYRPDGSSKTELAIYNPKTKHSKRKLPLEPVLIDALKRQKRNQITQKLVAGDSWQGSNALFTTKYGTRIFPSNISKRYRKLIAESQLRYVRIHDLRHTVASLLLENEMPVEEVSRLLGHSNIEITVNIYGSRVQALADRGALGMSKLYEEAKPRNAYFKKAEAL